MYIECEKNNFISSITKPVSQRIISRLFCRARTKGVNLPNDIEWTSLITFLLVTTLSPGPNNLSCASMGISHGYKRSLNYLFGIGIGLAILMVICGWISNLMRVYFSHFESALRVIGAVYIFWLAYKALQVNYGSKEEKKVLLGFKEGFILQYLNPKVILFGMTIYASYLLPATGDSLLLFASAVMLGLRAYLVNTIWVLFGAGIRQFLNRPYMGMIFNITIALMLVYNAADLLGLTDFLKRFLF